MTCIVQNGPYLELPAAEVSLDLGRPTDYRALFHQPDHRPASLLGKAVASIEEAQAIAERSWAHPHDFFWDQPNDDEKSAVAGIVSVMRPVDPRHAAEALRRRISAAAGAARSREITMSAVHPNGLTAWVESENDIAQLLVARDGRILLSRYLGQMDAYNFGYEGCQAQWLKWFGDRLVVVSYEKGSYLRSIDPLTGAEEGIHLGRDWVIEGALVIWSADDPGLLRIAALPSLDPWPPLPYRGAGHGSGIQMKRGAGGRLDVRKYVHGDPLIDSLALPAEGQRAQLSGPPRDLLTVLESRLNDGSPMIHLRLILESAAYSFIGVPPWRTRWQPNPRWIPVYLFRHLRSTGRQAEAALLLHTLERVAAALPEAQPESGWDPAWTMPQAWLDLAEHHCRRQASLQAGVCRSGVLPPGVQCLLFDPAPRSTLPGSRVNQHDFPKVLRRAFDDLLVTKPERLATTW